MSSTPLFFIFLLPLPPSGLPSQILHSNHLSKQFVNWSGQLRQLWEPEQTENTGDSGSWALSRAVVGDRWSLYPPGTVSLFQKMVMFQRTETRVWWCLWRLKCRCQVVPGSWVQFVSGAPLQVLPGSIQCLEGRHESLTLFSALSRAFLCWL